MIEKGKNKQDENILDIGCFSLPVGTQISKNSYGYCYIATKYFKKGDIVYECEYIEAPIQTKKFKFNINGTEYFCDEHNSVVFQQSRCFYTFGSFINHSCQQNTYTIQINGKQFQAACRDIQPGDQITTNYFHYDYYGCFQFKCQCNSPKCFGYVNGFKSLSLANKLSVLPRTLPCVKQYWVKDEQILLIQDLKIPHGFYLQKQGNINIVCSRQQYKADQMLFELQRQSILNKKDKIIYLVDQQYKIWNQARQFMYFISLLKQKNQPNCEIRIQNQSIKGVCLRNIHTGEQIVIW